MIFRKCVFNDTECLQTQGQITISHSYFKCKNNWLELYSHLGIGSVAAQAQAMDQYQHQLQVEGLFGVNLFHRRIDFNFNKTNTSATFQQVTTASPHNTPPVESTDSCDLL